MPIYCDWTRPLGHPEADAVIGSPRRPVYTFDVEAQTRTPADPETAAPFAWDLMRHLAQNVASVHAFDGEAGEGTVPVFPGTITPEVGRREPRGYVAVLPDAGPGPEWTLGARRPLFSRPRCAVVCVGGVGTYPDHQRTAQRAATLWDVCARTWAMEIPGDVDAVAAAPEPEPAPPANGGTFRIEDLNNIGDQPFARFPDNPYGFTQQEAGAFAFDTRTIPNRDLSRAVIATVTITELAFSGPQSATNIGEASLFDSSDGATGWFNFDNVTINPATLPGELSFSFEPFAPYVSAGLVFSPVGLPITIAGSINYTQQEA